MAQENLLAANSTVGQMGAADAEGASGSGGFGIEVREDATAEIDVVDADNGRSVEESGLYGKSGVVRHAEDTLRGKIGNVPVEAFGQRGWCNAAPLHLTRLSRP